MIKNLIIVLMLVSIELIPVPMHIPLDLGLIGLLLVALICGSAPWFLAILLGVHNDFLTGTVTGSFGLVYVMTLLCYQFFPIKLYLNFKNMLNMAVLFWLSACFLSVLVYFNFGFENWQIILDFTINHLAIWTFLAIICNLLRSLRDFKQPCFFRNNH